MNNLSSYCGLVDAKIKASDKDLPVTKSQIAQWDQKNSEVAFTFFLFCVIVKDYRRTIIEYLTPL